MLVDTCYLLNYSVLKQLQQFLILVQFHYFCFYQCLSLNFLIIVLFLLLIILIYSHQVIFILKTILFFYFIHINLYSRIICYSFMFFDDVFKINLYIRNRIRSTRQIKFIIPSWCRYFKFVAVVFRLNVFPCIIAT